MYYHERVRLLLTAYEGRKHDPEVTRLIEHAALFPLAHRARSSFTIGSKACDALHLNAWAFKCA